jgi:hypothetical protein
MASRTAACGFALALAETLSEREAAIGSDKGPASTTLRVNRKEE